MPRCVPTFLGPLRTSCGLLLWGALAPGWAQLPHAEVVEATVLYGDERLFEEHPADPDTWMDSLCTQSGTEEDALRDMAIFKRTLNMGDDELAALIDSLFELPEVPYALINEISLYIASRPTQADLDARPYTGWTFTEGVPCQDVYAGLWRCDHPSVYGTELANGDTTLLLELTRDHLGCGAHAPVEGVLTSRFGWRDGRPHNGIDLALRTGDPVHAMFPGVVRFAGSYSSYGRLVVVRHHNGLETYYAHLHRVKVAVGQEVDAGTLIGLGGSTGRSTGPHLHFEARFKGIPIDPMRFFDPATGRMTCNELMLKRTKWSYAAFPKGGITHVVASGEHMSAIAHRYGITVSELCALNGLQRSGKLRVGQELVIHEESTP
jgi:murein DD-endopeptidase MepM/ murein hydrolase activator NlpD